MADSRARCNVRLGHETTERRLRKHSRITRARSTIDALSRDSGCWLRARANASSVLVFLAREPIYRSLQVLDVALVLWLNFAVAYEYVFVRSVLYGYCAIALAELAVRVIAEGSFFYEHAPTLADMLCILVLVALTLWLSIHEGWSSCRWSSCTVDDAVLTLAVLVTGVRLKLRSFVRGLVLRVVLAYEALYIADLRVGMFDVASPELRDSLTALDGSDFFTFLQLVKQRREKARLHALVRSFVRDHVRAEDASAYGFQEVVTHLRELIVAAKERRTLLCIFGGMCVYSTVDPLNSYLLGVLYGELSDGNGVDSSFYAACGGLAGLYCVRLLSMFALQRLQAVLATSTTRTLRSQLVTLSVAADPTRLEFAPDGDLHLESRFASDIVRVASLLDKLVWSLLLPTIQLLVALVYLLVFYWRSGVLAVSLVSLAFAAGPKDTAAEKSSRFSVELGRTNEAFTESVRFAKVTTVFGAQDFVRGRVLGLVDDLRGHEFANVWWSANVYQTQLFCIYFWITAQTIFLALQASAGNVTAAQFSALVTLVTTLGSPAMKLSGFIWMALGSAGSLQSVNRTLAALERSAPGQRGSVVASGGGAPPPDALVVQGLELAYPGSEHNVLRGIDLVVRSGEFVVCVGPSGCGKTSLLRCVASSLGVDFGSFEQLKVGGVPIKDRAPPGPLGELSVGVVFQTSMLLPGLSLRDNVTCGARWREGEGEAEVEARVDAALRLAGCAKFVDALPEGLETRLGGGGESQPGLSGGQLQRVCIARALFREPDLLVLDEPTSALDPETEREVVATLAGLKQTKGSAVLLVTHNLANARSADRVVVFEGGTICEEGSFAELVERDGVFADMLRARNSC